MPRTFAGNANWGLFGLGAQLEAQAGESIGKGIASFGAGIGQGLNERQARAERAAERNRQQEQWNREMALREQSHQDNVDQGNLAILIPLMTKAMEERDGIAALAANAGIDPSQDPQVQSKMMEAAKKAESYETSVKTILGRRKAFACVGPT